MNQKLITEIGKSQRLQIVNQLKRTQGLTVGELAARLGMSYMGIKQHCIELSGKGYLDTWRRPKQIGRPEMVYRLTTRAHELFPVASNETTIALLESAKKLYGVSAPEKLLLLVFQKKEERYRTKVKGATLAARLQSLVKLRDQEGCMANFETDENGMRIVEHHSPIADLIQAFPLVIRLETEMFQRLLGVPVRREEIRASGLYSCAFHVSGGGEKAKPEQTAPDEMAVSESKEADEISVENVALNESTENANSSLSVTNSDDNEIAVSEKTSEDFSDEPAKPESADSDLADEKIGEAAAASSVINEEPILEKMPVPEISEEIPDPQNLQKPEESESVHAAPDATETKPVKKKKPQKSQDDELFLF